MQSTSRVLYHATRGIRLRGVIFDMDGTLTVPCLDFKGMRQKLGIIKEGVDVLVEVAGWPEEERARGMQVIEDIEAEGRMKLAVQPGALELFNFLEEKDMKRAILTRNSQHSITHFVEKAGLAESYWHALVSRDFTPCKPHPAGVLHIASQWGMKPHEIIFVGDSRDDLDCARAAGSVSCLLVNHLNGHLQGTADLHVTSLSDLPKIITDGFEVQR
eukprot:TRINITY_DN12609_c0_g1_i2.p1 TRINITY_DN12609_c0_g1~~TRINITY_DN12609_c0_g1_i2.p1  ORF type:complete len:216 (-),score=56.82 TRINITY_DN12609_c0_g1_i2:84-731(-)